MKLIKTLTILMICTCILSIDSYVSACTYSILPKEEKVGLPLKKDPYYHIYNINGKTYKAKKNIYDEEESSVYTYEYNGDIENRLIKACGFDEGYAHIDYVYGNGIYMVINNIFYTDPIFVLPDTCVYFLDEDFNLIKTENFGGCVWVYDIGYYDKTFYCTYKELLNKTYNSDGTFTMEREMELYRKYSEAVVNEVTVKSDDLVNWIETEEVPRTNGNTVVHNSQISLNGSNTLQNVVYENKVGKYVANYGPYLVYKPVEKMYNKNNDVLYFSDDGIYFFRVLPEDEAASWRMKNYVQLYIYTDGTTVFVNDIFELNTPLGISFEELNAELQKLKSQEAVYLKYNDTILASEQPPVIEDGRTLVPIRFLFEQMGATVDWNGETQTATITQNNTAVAFSIDDTEADVNGQTVSMDVPAKLVNGKTMVPVRFLSENLGYTVDWDGDNRIITIE